MKKEDVLNLMNTIPPDLIEEADVPLPDKRRLPKLARVGLIAACLCLALIGTAAAIHFSGVSIVDGDDGYTYLQGGIAYYSYDSLSDELKALDGVQTTPNGHLVRAVPSWQAAEDFIGVNLMDNPLLDASPADHFGFVFDGVRGPLVHITDPELSSAQAFSCYEIGGANILVEAHLFTDRKANLDEDWNEWFLGYGFPENTQVNRDTYTAPSGLTAQIMEITYPNNRKIAYKAAFSLNGIPIVVTADSGPDARAALIQILDGFVLSE